MPIHNQHYIDPKQGRHNPAALSGAGPVLQVEVNLPQPLINLLSSQNKPIPAPSPGFALIDTGASRTCIDSAVLSNLGISPIGVVTMGTAGGQTQCPLYPARLNFPVISLLVDFSSVAGVNLQGQTISGNPLVALIGRDVLSRCLFICSGTGGFFTLAL